MTATPPDDADSRHKALLTAGQAALNQGDFDAVRRITDEVFAIAPGSLNGFWLYLMSGQIAAGDAVFARIAAAAGQTGLPDPVASQLYFMLGKGHDDMGQTRAAFDAFVTANRLKRAVFDPAATHRMAEAIVAAAQAAPTGRLDPVAPRLVFVLGMPRSGTSLAAQMLAGHPGIANLGEQTALGAALTPPGRPGPDADALRTLDLTRLADVRALYLAGIGAERHPGKVLVDKMPENYWFAGVIPRLFPDALILHMRRPRLAIAWSCFRNDFREGHAYAADFHHILAQHDTHLRLTEAARGRGGENWHEIALDDLVAAPQAVLSPLLAALGLGWHADCAAPERGGDVATLSKWQVRQGVDQSLPQGWRRYLPLIRETWGVLD